MAEQLRETEAGTRGVRRILDRQIEASLEALERGDQPLGDEAVHDARKRIKKARASLRLLRNALGDRIYDDENAALRDAGRPLTEVRDARVLVDTFDKLTQGLDDQVDESALEGLRQALSDRYQKVRRQALEEGDLTPVREALEATQERARHWPVGRRGWSVVGDGLRRIYQRGRDAFARVREDTSVEALHEWRKQVKYLWHQFQVLRPLWPAVVEGLADQAHDLARLLGDDHDLAVLRQTLLDEAGRFAHQAALGPMVAVIDERRADLQAQALALGRRLYEEKPRALAARFKGYWRAWRRSPSLV
jgi:CHAD domain-containing protein